jgi:predicted Zn-dependent protease
VKSMFWLNSTIRYGAFAILCTGLFAQADEVEVGRELHEELLMTERFYQDEALNSYVNDIGQKLAANSDWPEIEYHFFVVDSGDINAFALPGGYIYLNRGLINYLTSEAQLAAVLAHEIAHVTRHHHDRRDRTNTMGNIAAFAASLITMNSGVGEAVSIWNAARVSGFGRDMELEADEYGAEYLYRTGYDPEAMIEVLGILKDHETFMNREARNAGAQSTYHGVFSSHPRGDTRLKEVVAQAGMLLPGEEFQGRDTYRGIVDGVVFGQSANSNAPPGKARYVHKGLAVTFTYPDDWERTTSGSTISVASRSGDIELKLEVAAITDNELTAEELLLARYSVDEILNTASHSPIYEEEEAITGFVQFGMLVQRVAAVKLGTNAYYFSTVLPGNADEEADQVQLEIMASFRQASQNDLPPDRELQIYYKRLEPGQAFLDLARTSVLGAQAEAYLRLINGYYPSGEAQPGTWMKLVE